MKANDMDSSTLSLAQAIEIIREFGTVLAKGMPPILDSQLLPRPKSIVEQAHLRYEQHLCDVANKYIASGRKDELKEINEILGRIRAIRGLLNAYSDIEPQDVQVVSYFNSFGTIKDVPHDESGRCLDLKLKYASKGMEAG